MKISDILVAAEAESYSAFFQKGLSVVLAAECEFEKDGVTIRAEHPDSHGLTFAGLNQEDDNLPVDSEGNVTATAEWIVSTYFSNYWVRVAGRLPGPLNWVFFSEAVNEGEETCVRLLQLALNDLERSHLVIDGQAGNLTLSACWSAGNTQGVALAFLSQCASRYKFLATTSEVVHDDLNGLLNRIANIKADLAT